jgi:hypothetical protein
MERRVSPFTSRRLIGFALLVRGELWLATEFDALRLCIGAASGCALHDAAMFELGGNAEDRKDDLAKVRGRIKERLGE